MMMVHESGHVLATVATGGQVERVIWHPLAMSRTDVRTTAFPLLVVWAGPVFGSAIPLLLMLIAVRLKWRLGYMVSFFAGFCLLVNGLYIGIGTIDPVGDAHHMLRLGTPRTALAIFGLTAVLGLWILERMSPSLGFGSKPQSISKKDARIALFAAIFLTCIGFILGNRGM